MRLLRGLVLANAHYPRADSLDDITIAFAQTPRPEPLTPEYQIL